ncbi:TPA: hypothetical protein ON591_002395 [Citrobacter freundii]|uniref:DUF6387 family protein n=1 Tax=Citrobacter freundii complex TaxID=1344959 RepID=UPI0008FD02F0|nr:DUF6387 family protein [Citrobacter freundii]EKW3669288.1 hypothetical protein [Citrobacter freundii]ELK7474898.1 hypothetical protein [Citrobacter freundii]MBJ9273948.1 hypothetical protein [Citrobacter freundii]OIZ33983.1 hypothetical protein BEH70_25365 [Citrobacter freundii]HBB6884273.1 hypothetical protein [Citrobacter freundii]
MISFQDYAKELGFDIMKYHGISDISDYDLVKQIEIREQRAKYIKGFVGEDESLYMSYVVGDSFDFLNDFSEERTKQFISSAEFKNMAVILYKKAYSELGLSFKKCFANPVLNFNDNSEHIHFEMKDVYRGFVPNMLSYSDFVKPLSRWTLENFIFGKASKGEGEGTPLMYSLDELDTLDENQEKLFSLSNESVNSVLSDSWNGEDFGHAMYLSLDLTKTDSEIIESLAKLLPIWRNELGLDIPEKKRPWSYIRGKIINYNVIPLIDLLDLAKIYTKIQKKRVAKRVISFMAFPNGERDGFGLDQTVMPFLEKIRSESYKLLSEYRINKR